MPRIVQQRIPKQAIEALKKTGIEFKKFDSASSFEKELLKFMKRNHVLHLSTCRGNTPRSTPLEYRSDGLTFLILSEGGGKFANLKENNKVALSIAEPYNSEDDYWAFKGLQAWGTAKIHSRKNNPEQFNNALKKMRIGKILKNLGIKELPAGINFKIIEIKPDIIRYGNPREGIYWVKWHRKG
ncbi:MAG: pyridoxamine 5'-phosphate oxidase family protein [Myxococcota bacterium]|nr:pyridoxamine 5'-phosphate oxidase family protein [Myxococcota bacterium]